MLSSLTRIAKRVGASRPVAFAGARSISKDVYIKGLPGYCQEDQFGEIMEQYGEISNLNLWKLPNVSNSFMFATVTYRDYESAFAAIDELDNTLMFGRRVSLEFSRTVVKSAYIQKQKKQRDLQNSKKDLKADTTANDDGGDSGDKEEHFGGDSEDKEEVGEDTQKENKAAV